MSDEDVEVPPKASLRHRLYHGETTINFVGRRNTWFAVSGLARSGKTRYYFQNTIVFGKKATYQFQAIAQSDEEAQALIKVVDAMKE